MLANRTRPGGQGVRRDTLTREKIVEIAGEIGAAKAAAIMATGASIEELEEAVAWAGGESDVMGDLRLRGSTVVGALYDILTADEKFGDERD